MALLHKDCLSISIQRAWCLWFITPVFEREKYSKYKFMGSKLKTQTSWICLNAQKLTKFKDSKVYISPFALEVEPCSEAALGAWNEHP